MYIYNNILLYTAYNSRPSSSPPVSTLPQVPESVPESTTTSSNSGSTEDISFYKYVVYWCTGSNIPYIYEYLRIHVLVHYIVLHLYICTRIYI